MNAVGKIPIFLVALGLTIALAACDSGGGGGNGDSNSPPTARLEASTTEAVVGDTVTVDASKSSDPDGDGLTFSWSAQTPEDSDVSLSGKTSSEVSFVADVSGDYDPEVTASDGNGGSDSKSVTVTALKTVPDEVTVSFENRAADGDSLIAKDLELAGELKVSGKKSGSFTTAGSRESKQLCAVEGEFFRRYCKEISLMSDQDVELRPDRKEVTVASTPKDSTGAVIPDAVTFVGSDSLKIEGDGSIERPKRSGTRTLVGDWITEEPNSSFINRYRSETITVSAAENIDREIIIDQLIPACSDGVDNDGDGAVDKADTVACTDLQGVYDPEDDNEVLNGFARGTASFFDDSLSVSKTAGKRTVKIRSANNPLPWSVTVAKGKIKHAIEVQRSDTIPNQAHATHLKTGRSNDNLTIEKTSDVTADADTANGFVWIRVHGIDRSFFADGPSYAVYGWHGCKALGNCGSIDGSGKFYYYVEQQNSRGHSWSYVYEPEDVPDNKQTSALQQGKAATLKSGECRQVSKTDEVCRVPAGEAKVY